MSPLLPIEEVGLVDPHIQAQALLAGLRDLRSRGRLCDVVLTAGADGRGLQQVAHQAVLAAVSGPLRRYFAEVPVDTSAEDCGELGMSPPCPQELRLDGLSEAGPAFEAAFAFAYGDAQAAVGAGASRELADLWGLTPAVSAEKVLEGLQKLRERGALCDIVISVGGQRFVAHQAVLAAASAPLRRYIMDRLRDLLASPAGEAPLESVASHAVALELSGVTQGDAVGVVLDFLYGKLRTDMVPEISSAAVLREVRQLAASLELPMLQAFAAKWALNVPASSGEARPAPGKKGKAVVHQREAERKVEEDDDAGDDGDVAEGTDGRDEEEDGGEGDEVGEEVEEDDDDEDRELERALYAMQLVRFSLEAKIPAGPSLAKELRSKRHLRILERLREAFGERPVWLDVALRKRLPASIDDDTLTRLMPFVAYQWIDGPWQKCFTSFGFDPREHANVAPLQVLQFRDPHWTQNGDSDDIDCTFRRPPSQRTQWYQLTDVQDDFFQSMVVSLEPEEACSRKTGWIPQFMLDALRDRLALRSQMLRERAAAKKAAQRAAARASVARGTKRSMGGRGAGGRAGKKARRGGG